MAQRGVELEGVKAERAVAVDRDDFGAGSRQRGGDRERYANPETAEHAGIEIGRGRQGDAREAENIAAVGDDDCVVVDHLPNCVEHTVGMHIAVGASRRRGHGGGELGAARAMLGAQTVDPRRVGGGRAIGGGGADGIEGKRRVGMNFDVAATVVIELIGGCPDPDKARFGKNRRRAVTELKIEAAADGEHQVGIAHRLGAHRADSRGMVVIDKAAALLGVEVGGAGGIEQFRQGAAGAAGAAPGYHQRAPRRPQQVDGGLHGVGRRRHGGRARLFE